MSPGDLFLRQAYLGVYSITSQYALFVTIPLVGLAQGSGITVAQSLGREHYANARRQGNSGIILVNISLNRGGHFSTAL